MPVPTVGDDAIGSSNLPSGLQPLPTFTQPDVLARVHVDYQMWRRAYGPTVVECSQNARLQ